MKTINQINTAIETIKELQDYVELARCQKKLKKQDNVEFIDIQISNSVEEIKNNIEGI